MKHFCYAFVVLCMVCISCVDTVRDACHIKGNFVYCPKDGTRLELGQSGVDGANGMSGSDGLNGESGVDGITPVISLLEATAEQCPNGGTILIAQTGEEYQSAVICNGSNGADGEDGVDGQDTPAAPLQIVALLNPCGDAAGIADEILLGLQDGTILASFSSNASGANTRFAVLTAGSYVTTDGDLCYFTVTGTGSLINEHH